MKIMIFGSDGMLGSDISKSLRFSPISEDMDLSLITEDNVDITKREEAFDIIESYGPDIIINCAAYTDVDGCEKNSDLALAINSGGVKNIVDCITKSNAKIIHFSTDYVFDGRKDSPYNESDPPNPLNVYGSSKLMGDNYIRENLVDYLIIRTAWLYGKNGKHFIKTIINLSSERNELRVVTDQVGTPTYTKDLAEATRRLIPLGVRGMFNVVNSGYCSWYEFAAEILKLAKINDVEVKGILSDELNRPAPRPAFSILDCDKYKNTAGEMRSWKEALEDFMVNEFL